MRTNFGLLTLACALALAGSVINGSETDPSGINKAALERERELRADAASQRQLQARQAAARAQAHARMPSTMYASTPSDTNSSPHVAPDMEAQTDAIVDIVVPRYLQSVAEADSTPFSQRLKEAQMTLQTVEQRRAYRDFARERPQWRHSQTNSLLAPTPQIIRAAEQLVVPYFPSAIDPSGRRGVVRLANRTKGTAVATIHAVDDNGSAAEPLNLSIAANSSVHFDSTDLEQGNAAKGIDIGIGAGQGAWTLRISSTSQLDALAYVETLDGVLSLIHASTAPHNDIATAATPTTLNRAGSWGLLRLVNLTPKTATAVISQRNSPTPASDTVTVELPAHQARTYATHELSSGAAPGLIGSLGDQDGEPQLTIQSEAGVLAVNLAASAAGHLTNLPLPASARTTHTVPLFLSAAAAHGRQSVVRVVNRNDTAGQVRIQAIDDAGHAYHALNLALASNATVEFDSNDLELGNPDIGLTGITGRGEGDWRLELDSELEVQVWSFVRTPDGLLAPMQDTVAATENIHHVALFKAVSDAGPASVLRLINPNVRPANVTIQGTDDSGVRRGSTQLTLAPKTSRVLTNAELELGGENLIGAFGDGDGDWRLTVSADATVQVMNLIASPSGHLTNLSTAASVPANDEETAASVFEASISPVVQSTCINCHNPRGIARNTRLGFVFDDDEDHLTKNIGAFQALLDEVDDGAKYVLNKVQGVGHGGGAVIPAGTTTFRAMERFLELLGEEVDDGPSVTPETLFEGVTLESQQQTLRRAALIFAGRTPTAAEYATLVADDEASLRTAIRGLMQGPGFHDFLIRGSNDRLFTDRDLQAVISPDGEFFVDFTNKNHELASSDLARDDLYAWQERAQYGFRRAPLELIAHVAQNDLPYTTILTADFIMANPIAAAAYGAETTFTNPDDVHEFQPSRIVKYYRNDDSKVLTYSDESGTHISAPGDLSTHYPHAGILNTTVFLKRYPTTATNRNRARSRWTYYHFLGIDIEKSAPRTTDPVALADTNNPTRNNAACTVCHSVLDPVAGAFQNYGDEGLYRDQWGGMDSLDGQYKEGTDTFGNFSVSADTYANRQTFTHGVSLQNGSRLTFAHPQNHGCGDSGEEACGRDLRIDEFFIRDRQGRVVDRIEWSELDEHCEDEGQYEAGTGDDDHYQWWGWSCYIPTAVTETNDYEVVITLWADQAGGKVTTFSVGASLYLDGDTWYRDMRTPGFGETDAPSAANSVQWLAERIIADQRFAEATVRFWWPAIMGSETIEPPEDESDADYQATLLAANAQSAEVRRLAQGFASGFGEGKAFNVKDLFVEISVSPWFRAMAVGNEEPLRTAALRDAGASRLLTPAELATKTRHLTGFEWGYTRNQPWAQPHEEENNLLTDAREGYRLIYGGIDSDGITERARDLTSVMAGVAQTHAVESSCPIVMRELYLLPDEKRLLLDGVDTLLTPTREFAKSLEIKGASRSEIAAFAIKGPLRTGDATIHLAFLNPTEDEDRGILLDRVRVLRGTTVILDRDMATHQHEATCHVIEQNAFHLSKGGPECTLAIPVTIASDATYTVEVSAWGSQAGDEKPRLAVIVDTDAESSAGALAIREKLAQMHNKLHGTNLAPESDEVRATYGLFVESWQRYAASERKQWQSGYRCEWAEDSRFLDGILENAWVFNETEGYYDWDWPRVESYFESVDLSDPQGIARPWVAVLTHLLIDFRYLYL